MYPMHGRVCLNRFIDLKVYGKRFLDENINFSIISQSSSRTFKAHNDTRIETSRNFENRKNPM